MRGILSVVKMTLCIFYRLRIAYFGPWQGKIEKNAAKICNQLSDRWVAKC